MALPCTDDQDQPRRAVRGYLETHNAFDARTRTRHAAVREDRPCGLAIRKGDLRCHAKRLFERVGHGPEVVERVLETTIMDGIPVGVESL